MDSKKSRKKTGVTPANGQVFHVLTKNQKVMFVQAVLAIRRGVICAQRRKK
jgi:hypothetical protein